MEGMKVLMISAVLALAAATPAVVRPQSRRNLHGAHFFRNPQDDLVVVRCRVVQPDLNPDMRLSMRRYAEGPSARSRCLKVRPGIAQLQHLVTENSMKVFSISVAVAITLAISAATGLIFLVQKTSAQSY